MAYNAMDIDFTDKKNVRNVSLTIRLTATEKEALLIYCKCLGISASQFLRKLAQNYMDSHSIDISKAEDIIKVRK